MKRGERREGGSAAEIRKVPTNRPERPINEAPHKLKRCAFVGNCCGKIGQAAAYPRRIQSLHAWRPSLMDNPDSCGEKATQGADGPAKECRKILPTSRVGDATQDNGEGLEARRGITVLRSDHFRQLEACSEHFHVFNRKAEELEGVLGEVLEIEAGAKSGGAGTPTGAHHMLQKYGQHTGVT